MDFGLRNFGVIFQPLQVLTIDNTNISILTNFSKGTVTKITFLLPILYGFYKVYILIIQNHFIIKFLYNSYKFFFLLAERKIS